MLQHTPGFALAFQMVSKGLKMRFRLSHVALRFLVLLAAIVSVNVPAVASTAQTGLPVEALVVTSGERSHRFKVDVAATDRQRSMGLMFREQMDPDQGMLFVFDGEGQRYFWMKNTPLPLDIIFIGSNGVIVSIAADTTPYSTDTVPSGKPARFVLELNAGTAAKLGIEAGDTVKSPSIAAE